MSFSVDTNILLFAYNQDSLKHRPAKSFLETRLQSPDVWVMPWPVIHAFLRISTHPAIFTSPLSIRESISIIKEFLEHPRLLLAGETPEFWEIYEKELLSVSARGNLVPDTQISALLKLNGVKTLYSCDRDFRKFDGLKVIDPL